ncbi:bifunctional serine/threonine-protein kinase/formylglycine-generating enzyme family protein [Prosthecobacter sp.]|uniref:bifunctional serine/threonine-protein kinase/formylglycine-generating enzyme family protein n=1 Tax=Prosthecobacter sp. TaxID=1965333 RepID=UPI001DE2ADBA|nr:bifunctional serine/threonine-protein kinase/formylglycine-generating enzyme family protein [Prosthecobacter sp.]MCB1279429.1 protein kinase [Prosthecobacter sp.]
MPEPDHAPDLDATIRVAGPSPPTDSRDPQDVPMPQELARLLPVDNYTVEGFLGAGGMGAVYKGTQVRLQRKVAIKIMRRDRAKDQGFEERFRREALAMAQLNHPNIVNVIDYGEAGPEYLYIVMEFIDGTDLVNVIRSGQMTQETALKLLPQICDALQFAHDNGIVHRDIKPANILLTRDGRIKMADFGLAKRFDAENSYHTQTGYGMGTPDYAAPEQFMGDANVDHRADIYALGVMIYQMVTGTLPRGAWKPPSEKAGVDSYWDHIVARALQTDPHERYASVSEIKTDLGGITTVTGGQPLASDGVQNRKTAGMTGTKGSTTALTQAGGRPATKAQPHPDQKDAPFTKNNRVWGSALIVAGTIVLLAGGYFTWEKFEAAAPLPASASAVPSVPPTSMARTWTAPTPTASVGTEWTNLIPHIQPQRDVIRGEWSVDENGLHAKRAQWALCNIPVQDPGTDYDLRYKVTRGEGSHLAMFFAFRKGRTGGYVPIDYTLAHLPEFADGQRWITIEDLTNLEMRDAATPRAKRKEWLPKGKACTILLQVRDKEVIVSVNDEEAFRWPAEWSKLQQKGGAGGSMFLDVAGDPIFGVGIFNCEATFHSIEMKKMESGKSESSPPPGITIGDTWTDLVPHVKLDRDVVRGDWKSGKEGLACVNLVKWSLCKLPVKQPEGDYEIRCRLTRTGGPVDGLFFPFRWGDTGGSIGIDYPGLVYFDGLRRAGLERIEGRDLKTPSDMVSARKEWIPMGKTSTVLLQVGAKEVRLMVDDVEAVHWKADWSQIRQTGSGTPWSGVFTGLSGPIFGIGMYNSEVTYHSIEMRRVGTPSASTPAAATKDAPFVNTLGMKFVPVPITGGPTDKQRVLFSIWETRVQDYEAFAKETKREWPKPVFQQAATHPAVNLNSDDAAAFCAWLTERERKAGKLAANEVYRLPSDHEWSCVAGIGDQEDAAKPPNEKSGKIPAVYPWGTQWPPPRDAGNYSGEEFRDDPQSRTGNRIMLDGHNDGFVHSSPVGSFAANPLGLYDLGGNAWEWCVDLHPASHASCLVRGASSDDGKSRVMQSSWRITPPPSTRQPNYGFRCVLELAPSVAVPTTSAASPAFSSFVPVVRWVGHEVTVTPESTNQELPVKLADGGIRVRYRVLEAGRSYVELVLRRSSLHGNLPRYGITLWSDSGTGSSILIMDDPPKSPHRVLAKVATRPSANPGEEHCLEFYAIGDRLTFFMDGKELATGTDNRLAEGYAALAAVGPIKVISVETADLSEAAKNRESAAPSATKPAP